MFTGIITDIGTIRSAEQRGDLRLVIGSTYDMETVDLGASIACSGACLTVVDKGDDWFAVDLSQESVARTAPDLWSEGGRLNLERALRVGDELGGHIVTGHVDTIATVTQAVEVGGSINVTLEVPRAFGGAIAAKGSVALDGVSLTVNEVEDEGEVTRFTINLIPHTAGHTTLGSIGQGRRLNFEVDVLARYLERMMEARANR